MVDLAPGVGGGESVVIPALASTMRDRVILAGSAPVIDLGAAHGIECVQLDLPGVRAPLSGALRLAVGGRKVAALAKRLGAGVIYANDARGIAYCLAAGKISGLPVVAHNHELLTRGGFVRAMERLATTIIVPSRAAASPFRRGRVKIIPTGRDLVRFAPPGDKLAAKRLAGLDGPVVGSVGRADPAKGMQAFVEVAAELASRRPEARFLLVGGAVFPHERPFFEELQAKAVGLFGDRIVMPGVVSDTAGWLHAMDMIVHLSEPETLPTTLIEAMACGVPAVAYDGGGVPEIVTERTGRLVAQGDRDGAVREIVELLGAPERLSTMSDACRREAESKFSLDRFHRQLRAVVEEAQANSSR